MNDIVGPSELREDLKKDVLLVGCGNVHNKRIKFEGVDDMVGPGSPWDKFEQYARLHLSDFDQMICDKYNGTYWNLEEFPYPWLDDSMDEIHAYEVLEHCGSQGDGDYFFAQFNEFWRILKPGGYMMISVPMWDAEVAWGVPDHKRVMPPGLFGFLTEDYYKDVGVKEGYGDYRHHLQGRYWTAVAKHESEEQLHVVLRKNAST